MRAYEQVEAMLRARLGDGSLAPGTVLLEGPIATSLGISRTPVRQALERLRSDGLLSAFDGRGLVVGDGSAAPSRDDVAGLLGGSSAEAVRRTWAWQKEHDDVERALVRLAVLGRFRVNEAALADHLGMGRTVARDVMLRIETSGVVAKTEKGHWVTVPLDAARVADLYAVRDLLEGTAVHEAAARVPRAEVESMVARLEVARAVYPDASPRALDALETDLHVSCVSHAANREIPGFLVRTRCIIVSSKHLLGSEDAMPHDDPFMDEHHAVLAALLRADGPGAHRAMSAHLSSACAKVTARLDAYRSAHPAPTLPYARRL